MHTEPATVIIGTPDTEAQIQEDHTTAILTVVHMVMVTAMEIITIVIIPETVITQTIVMKITITALITILTVTILEMLQKIKTFISKENEKIPYQSVIRNGYFA